MVRHAARTVPYYREWFRQQGVDPDEIRTAEDLARLPLIDRDVVRQRPQRFVSTSREAMSAIPFHTSGTSGSHMVVYHDRQYLWARLAIAQRQRQAEKAILGGAPKRTLSIAYRGRSIDTHRSFLQESTFLRSRSDVLRLYGTESSEATIAAINRYRPDVIRGPGSHVEALFRTIVARSAKVHLPRLIVYGAETMTAGGKRLIEEQLGISVLANYGAVEAPYIGFTCQQRSGFHLNSDVVHIRIVDADGKSVPKGEEGEIVISNLINQGTVLLNYRLGDIGKLSCERCRCGRTLPLLDDLQGRVDEVIYLPGGEFVCSGQIWSVFEHRHDVIRYQMVQHSMQHFELRLMTVDRATFEHVKDDIVADLRPLLGESCRIKLVYHQQLKAEEGQKFKLVVSHVSPFPPALGTG